MSGERGGHKLTYNPFAKYMFPWYARQYVQQPDLIKMSTEYVFTHQ
jgi:hypothetical protein